MTTAGIFSILTCCVMQMVAMNYRPHSFGFRIVIFLLHRMPFRTQSNWAVAVSSKKKSKGSPRLADRNESIIFSSTYLQMHLRVCCSNKAIRKVISLVSQWDAFEGSAQTEWSAVISTENLAAVRWIIRSEVFFIPFFFWRQYWEMKIT